MEFVMTTNQTYQLNDAIYFCNVMLAGDYLPLYLPFVKGRNYSAFVDSGTKTMFPLLQRTLAHAGVPDGAVRFVIQTTRTPITSGATCSSGSRRGA
jgi:hypothetical protein